MVIRQTNIKISGRRVGSVDYPSFDHIKEAKDLLGEARVLELLNAQIKTLAMNWGRQTIADAAVKVRPAQCEVPDTLTKGQTQPPVPMVEFHR